MLSTVNKVLLGVIAGLLGLSVAFGGLSYYRGTVIENQKEQLELYAKDKKAQEKADAQLKTDKAKLKKERDSLKGKLEDALKNNKCADAPFDDDTQRLLNQLYGKSS